MIPEAVHAMRAVTQRDAYPEALCQEAPVFMQRGQVVAMLALVMGLMTVLHQGVTMAIMVAKMLISCRILTPNADRIIQLFVSPSIRVPKK